VMYAYHPDLRLGEDDWKVERLAIENYPGWKRGRADAMRNLSIKQETETHLLNKGVEVVKKKRKEAPTALTPIKPEKVPRTTLANKVGDNVKLFDHDLGTLPTIQDTPPPAAIPEPIINHPASIFKEQLTRTNPDTPESLPASPLAERCDGLQSTTTDDTTTPIDESRNTDSTSLEPLVSGADEEPQLVPSQ
jgi:hypothetical protein